MKENPVHRRRRQQYYFVTTARHLPAPWPISTKNGEDQPVLQVDQAEPEDRDLPRYLVKCVAHADLGGTVCVPGVCVPGVSSKDRSINAADLAVITTESVRAAHLESLIQTTEI